MSGKFNRQAALNTMVNHLRKQGKPAVNREGYCLYRGADGSKCAVGALIPDDKYHPSMETQIPTRVSRGAARVRGAVGVRGADSEDTRFLEDCQRLLHDGNKEKENFRAGVENGAARVARLWNLEVPA